MHIAFSADDPFLPHAATMLRSLRVANPGEDLVLHLLHDTYLSKDRLLQLVRWLEQSGEALHVHSIPTEATRGFPDRFHRSVWYRVLLPELLPDTGKILYLDADTLVLDRLRPLWQTDLANHLFAAVVNPIYPYMRDWVLNRPHMPPAARYMNSGVLLLDLERMRQQDCTEAFRRYATRHPENPYPEQDALAALFHNRCLFLHPRWNVQTTFFNMALTDIPWPADEIAAARKNPAIVHFIGLNKPDHYLCRNPYRDIYLRHRRDTPWPLARVAARNPVNFVLQRLPVTWELRYNRVRKSLRGLLDRLARRPPQTLIP